MKAYICTVCSFLYDEENAEKNIEDNIIPFQDLNSEWICPNCGVTANFFKPVDPVDSDNNNNINNENKEL